ncbi:MAG: thiamine-phosphate kinase [Vibrionaceae bacterium]
MSLSEFELIERYCLRQKVERDDVLVGIGDDAAVLRVPEGMRLAVTTDSLVAGNHFPADVDPALLAHKALIANISDLAAMGAVPAWCSLALTLPKIDTDWLEKFCGHFFSLAHEHQITLIGGDTTKGPLALTITLQGFVEEDKIMRRVGAKAGDLVFVTGNLGDSAAGLDVILNGFRLRNALEQQLAERHFLRNARVNVGSAIAPLASACIDISDGLTADLQHILNASGVGAHLIADKLPLSKALATYTLCAKQAAQMALTSGEEYELCFTAPVSAQPELEQKLAALGVKLTCIGQIEAQPGMRVTWQDEPVDWSLEGWDHFLVTAGINGYF